MRSFKLIFSKIFIIALFNASFLHAAPQFSDGFESGDLSRNENGVSYLASTNAEVSSEVAKEGQNSLRFFFRGRPSGDDAFSEQRMSLPQTNEIWLKYDFYVPANYDHRHQSGASNNKFLAIYKNDYRNPGFQVNWSLATNGTGGSQLVLHQYRNGREQAILTPSGGIGNNFLTAADQGKWIQIVVRVKVPSNGSATDGIMQMWKDGTLVTNETSLNMYGGDNQNFIDELYLLGWSNSGYSEDTIFYIDNLLVNNEPFVKPLPPVSNVE